MADIGLAKRYINEDWHLWLRMLQDGCYPVHMHFYGFWYRRKKSESLLKEINDTNNPNNKLRIEAIQKEAEKITENIKAIELPNDKIVTKSDIDFPDWSRTQNNKKNILVITKYLKTDTHILDILNNEANSNITIVTTSKCPYIGRQWYEDKAEIFDTTTFLPQKNQEDFIKYIIKTRNIKTTYLCNNSEFINCVDTEEIIEKNYVEDESKYVLYEKKYKFRKSILGRIINKIKNI